MHPTIDFYLRRDGEASTRETLKMQLGVTVRSVISAESHASNPQYRGKFIDDAKAYAEFLGEDEATRVLQVVISQVRTKRAAVSDRQARFSDQLLKADGIPSQELLERLRPYPLREDEPSATTAGDQADVAERLKRAIELLKANGLPTAGLE